jgi:hypothetical protein
VQLYFYESYACINTAKQAQLLIEQIVLGEYGVLCISLTAFRHEHAL